jgi:hypothetical protein
MIAPIVVNSGNGGTWASIILGQSFTPLTDFHVEFDFSWDSEGTYRAMQVLFISLYDPNDNLISEVSYYDAWVGSRGAEYGSAKIGEEYDSCNYMEPVFKFQAGGNYYYSGPSYLDYSGSASIDIFRIGSNITISWNGSNMVSGVANDPISKVLVVFMYYPYQGQHGVSFFGTQSVDLVKIEGTPIHEPIVIDIKPGSYPNSINLKSNGVVPVAILSTSDFEATAVVPGTVLFADASPVKWTMEDVNQDGDMDLLLHFRTQELNLTQDSTEATLTGETMDGTPIEGTDTVNIVPKKKK